MILRRIMATAAALSLLAGAATAAPVAADQGATPVKQGMGFSLSVRGEQGTTLVNQGGGFAPTAGTTELKPGDRVLVRKGGTATITYPDGCTVPVHGMATVDPLSPASLWLPIYPRGGRRLSRMWHLWLRNHFHGCRWGWWPWPAVASRVLSFAVTTTTTTTFLSFRRSSRAVPD